MTVTAELPPTRESSDVRYASDVAESCREAGWSRNLLIQNLRRVARNREDATVLPDDDSLKRMIRQWASGHRGLSPFYAQLLTEVFGAAFVPGWSQAPKPRPHRATTVELAKLRAEIARLTAAAERGTGTHLHPDRLRRLSRGWDSTQLVTRMKLEAERQGVTLPKAYELVRWLFLWENHRALLPEVWAPILAHVLYAPPAAARNTARVEDVVRGMATSAR